ncbi:hypothetical protein UlMin_005780 [Ulmus minor]
MNTQTSSSEVSSRPELNITKNSSPLVTNHKLNSNNFLQWSQSIFMYICGRGKDEYLTGEVSIPVATNPKYRTWKTENHMVMSWLINSMTIEVGERELSITQYFNILTCYWQQLDMFEIHSWKCPSDFALYKKIVDQKRTFKFLLGLSKELDEVRGRIMGIKPLPTIQEAISEVRREESRRKLMMNDNLSTPTVEGLALNTHNSSQDNKQRKGRPWCEHCKKPGHTKETCWKIHVKPADWKPNRARNDWETRANIAATLGDNTKTNPFTREQIEALQKLIG